MTITLINGSLAKKSHIFVLLLYIETLLEAKKIDTVLWDLRERPLINVIPEYHKNPWDTPDERVQEFVALIQRSDGIVLGSPLYHGSFSGVLKNALDNLQADAFRHKPVALVSNAGGVRVAEKAAEALRPVVRALYGHAIQTQIGTTKSDYEETDSGYILISDDIKERCQRLVDELIQFTALLKPQGEKLR